MAFGIKGADAFKDDPSLVEWLVRIAESDEQGTKNVRDVGVHLCAEQDWDRFYEPSKKAKARFESLKKGGMYCMNNVDGKCTKQRRMDPLTKCPLVHQLAADP